jgi:pyridoxal phosphate enzyme (YggS family)
MLVKKEQGAYNGAPLHFIGNLQSNKISKVVGVCDLIESVSSESLITAIGRKAEALEIVQNVLIEINIGKEPQKQGILPENINRALDLVSQTKGIKVLGLMTIPPIFNKIERNCNYFDIMYQLFVDIRAKNSDNVLVQFLSMGMSDTYIEAIRAGSNMVRVGTAIFGER